MAKARRLTGPAVARVIVAFVWIAGAIFNIVWSLPRAADVWSDFGESATFAPYRWLFSDIIGAASAFWAWMLVAGELALDILLLLKGRWARTGLVASSPWSLFLSFLIVPYTLMMPFFALLTLWLLHVYPDVGRGDGVHVPTTFAHVVRKGAYR